jgi:2-polyprenyl-3-methyl-5-hydroxy-6-metoxy-1,4-benzoquinol methylase
MNSLLPDDWTRGLARGTMILDLGCGTGLHANELAAAGFHVIAADADLDAVATARELAGEGTIRPAWVVARAEATPFHRGTFAAVLCLDVLHWAHDDATFEAMWRGAWDALAPGGCFLVRTLFGDAFPSATLLQNGRHRLESGAEWFLPTLALMRALSTRSGAEPPDVFPSGQEGSVYVLSRKPC